MVGGGGEELYCRQLCIKISLTTKRVIDDLVSPLT